MVIRAQFPRIVGVLVVAGIGLRMLCPATAGADDDTAKIEFFESRIRPVLVKHCYRCHSANAIVNNRLRGGLRLDGRESAQRGGDSGPVIVAGKPKQSSLLAALRYEDLEMPPAGALPERVVRDFERWIADGAAWPATSGSAMTNHSKRQDYAHWRSAHWAWRPIAAQRPPAVDGDGWSTTPIDRFVLARLRAAGLSPSPPADRATLYRRAHVGLLGLPPSYEETQRFVRDVRPQAFVRAVDRLLASPAYGEKWGRHWLDVARYANNGGFNSQTKELYTDFPYAYTYRDYVVRAFNEDLPYDQFIIEQLAADRLELKDDNRALAALGFLTLGDKSFGTSSADRVDDCIDTVTRGLMAITVSCARCHDHKYDPIPTEDYYSLFSVFQNSEIDVASRLHTREKSSVLPMLFASHGERLQFEDNVAQAAKQLEEARIRFHAKASEHLRRRIADYMLAAANRADEARKAGLNQEVLKRWRTYLKLSADKNRPDFLPWRTFLTAADNASKETLEKKLGELDTAASDHASRTVLAELKKGPLHSLADVADAYGRLLRLHKQKSSPVSTDKNLTPFADVLSGKESPIELPRDMALKLPVHGGVQQLGRLRNALQRIRLDQPRAVSLRDKRRMSQGHVFTRGNSAKPGKPVSRRFLALLSKSQQDFRQGSGRLELARAIVNPQNPLTARVLVNRVWQHHFGAGLVAGASDFGLRSDPPTHPQLLDHLAAGFMADGWSLKRLHRRILLSQTYRQASYDRPHAAQDPENRLLWRMNRRRLMFESLRDALLAASGQLDRSIGGPPVPTWASRRRTIYGYVNRYRPEPGYSTFDFPSSLRTSPGRSETLVPQQSLFLMNAPFVQQRVLALASDPAISKPDTSDNESMARKVEFIYRRILGRNPDLAETHLAIQFVTNASNAGASDQKSVAAPAWQRLTQALFLSNEFIYLH